MKTQAKNLKVGNFVKWDKHLINVTGLKTETLKNGKEIIVIKGTINNKKTNEKFSTDKFPFKVFFKSETKVQIQ